MKLLFGENWSPRLVSALADLWPGSAHVESINTRGATDEALWSFAHAHGFTLVSKDDDFRSLALVRGAPPKVIWLQIGNAPTSKVADLLRPNASALDAFSVQPAEA